MDRSSDRFARHARRATVGLSALLVFGLHVDSLAILGQLTTDAAVRTALVDQVGAALQTAQGLGGPSPAQQALRETMDRVSARDPAAAQALQAFAQQSPTCTQAAAWMAGPAAPALADESKTAFRDTCARLTREYVEGMAQAWRSITGPLHVDGLRLFEPGGGDGRCGYWMACTDARSLAGTLMTALFLSLGAPFWFNVLCRLSNLRPILADKVRKEATRSARQ